MGLANGTVITNNAGIYFDANPVVWTNNAENVICYICGPDDVKNINMSEAQIYPNPVTTQLNINALNKTYNSFYITNTIGQQLLAGKIEMDKISVDVSVLPAGMYYITLKGELGNMVRKFVKL
jgi:hypothetical protein